MISLPVDLYLDPAATITATVTNPCYAFVNWTTNGIPFSTSPTNTGIWVTTNQVFTANFAVIPHNITLGFSTPLWSTSGFNLMLQGPIGSNYQVKGSTDLSNWVPVTNFTSSNSPVYFSDPAATGLEQRFYRALMQ